MAGASYTANSSTTLYAVWEIKTYSVTYNANGGTGAPASQVKTYDVPLTLSSSVPSKDGYTFAGWSTNKDADEAEYTSGDIYYGNSAVVLYAVWNEIYIKSISVASLPDKTEYKTGETFDPSGLKITAQMSDGSESAVAGGYTISVDGGKTFSSAGEKTVTVTYNGVTAQFAVTVTEDVPDIPETSASLSVSNKSVRAGDEFTLDVNITDNPGFCYLKLRLSYDKNKFELISADNGEVFPGSFSFSSDAILFDSDKNADSDGKLVTLKFKSKDDIDEGEYIISVNFVESYNFDEENLTFASCSSSITVSGVIYGDVTGDGVINGKDLVRLRKYLLTLDETTGKADVEISLGADTTGDGVINGKDLVRLRKYLLNYDESTGTSPIILGPAS